MGPLSQRALLLLLPALLGAGCGGQQVYRQAAAPHGSSCLPAPFARNTYHAGQMLSAEDLRAEQSYHRGKAHLHCRLLHGWGVVCGLQVQAAPDQPGYVVVSPGFALDGQGREILVPSPYTVPLAEHSGDVYLAVWYAEQPVSLVPTPGAPAAGGGQAAAAASIGEGFAFSVLRELPPDYVPSFDLLTAAASGKLSVEQVFARRTTCCIEPNQAPVVLARIRARRKGRVQPEDIDNVHFRRLVLTAADLLEH